MLVHTSVQGRHERVDQWADTTSLSGKRDQRTEIGEMYDRTSWLPQVGAVSQALSQIATLAMPTKTPFDSSARPMLDAMKGPGTTA